MQNFNHFNFPNGDVGEPPVIYNQEPMQGFIQFNPTNDDEYSPSIGKKLSTVSEDRTNEAISESVVDMRESLITLKPEAPPQPLEAYLDLRQSNTSDIARRNGVISFAEFPACL